MNFAILSCENSPLLEQLLAEFRNFLLPPPALIIDGKLTERDIELTLERMLPNYKIKSVHEMDIGLSEIIRVENHNSAETLDWIKRNKISFLLNGGTLRILKSELLSSTGGVLNCHPGLLPQYRGCSAVEWAIYNGDAVGATAHFMTEGIDEGPIIVAETLQVSAGETYESIRTRMNELQARLLAFACKHLVNSKMKLKDFSPQEDGTYYKPISPEKMYVVRQKIENGEYSSPKQLNPNR